MAANLSDPATVVVVVSVWVSEYRLGMGCSALLIVVLPLFRSTLTDPRQCICSEHRRDIWISGIKLSHQRLYLAHGQRRDAQAAKCLKSSYKQTLEREL